MLGQRRRELANIKPALDQRLAFAGIIRLPWFISTESETSVKNETKQELL